MNRFLMIDLSAHALTPDERAFLRNHPLAGVCLFRRNIRDRHQLADYVAELRRLAGEELLVAVDQEGGPVVRIVDVPYPPGAMALGSADDPELTRRVAAAAARGLRALGINVDFAPVADVNSNPRNPVIGDRAFGGDPARVAAQVVAFVQGLQQEGVAATVKHFPGHGDTATDSHLALPRLAADRERLEEVELVPFRAAVRAGVAAVMSGHLLVPALDPDAPATLSGPLLTGLLREQLGFDGVVFSDALDMKAITSRYGHVEAAVRALAAGVDVPVHIGPLREHEEILAGVEAALAEGRLAAEAARRSRGRVALLARRYPAGPAPGTAWQEGDEALLSEAGRRAVAALGALPRLERGARLVLIGAGSPEGGAASDRLEAPAVAFARALEAAGFEVERCFYDRSRLADERERLLTQARGAGMTLFASGSRTRMEAAERELAQAVAAAAPRFLHVALWNPYHVQDVPGPALISFGFHPASVTAAAAVLAGAEAPGRLPVELLPG